MVTRRICPDVPERLSEPSIFDNQRRHRQTWRTADWLWIRNWRLTPSLARTR